MVDLNTGSKEVLEIKPEKKRCHFTKKFSFQDYILRLRLDWADIVNGEPMLDADIWTETHGKKHFLRKDRWHHTQMEYNDQVDRKTYLFKFNGL